MSFFSLPELNAAILEGVKAFNRTPFQKMSGTRQSRFEDVDQPALRPLPTNPYEYGEWTSMRKVAPDYHVQIEKHCYSVPYSYLGRSVRGLIRSSTVEIYDGENRIASHVRRRSGGQYTTDPLHMPDHHRKIQPQEGIKAHFRDAMVFSDRHYIHYPRISASLGERQKQCNARTVAISQRARKRLHQRYRALAKRKPPKVAVVALARELVGFLWEAMQFPVQTA